MGIAAGGTEWVRVGGHSGTQRLDGMGTHSGLGREGEHGGTQRVGGTHRGLPTGPATLYRPPAAPGGRRVPGNALAPHSGTPPPTPNRETSSSFSTAGAPPGTDRPPPAIPPPTHGVHRSLNSLATVSMPPARATAM